jgi:hypothetical protein
MSRVLAWFGGGDGTSVRKRADWGRAIPLSEDVQSIVSRSPSPSIDDFFSQYLVTVQARYGFELVPGFDRGRGPTGVQFLKDRSPIGWAYPGHQPFPRLQLSSPAAEEIAAAFDRNVYPGTDGRSVLVDVQSRTDFDVAVEVTARVLDHAVSDGGAENEPTLATTGWNLEPGAEVSRSELHDRFGGNRQRGIAPSNSTPNILLFTDPAGKQHGYMDEWDGDTLHYYGEGQRGNQQLTAGNKAILEHVDKRRALRVFQGVGGVVRYLGEFRLDEGEPMYWTETAGTGGGPTREAVVFRLIPTDYPSQLAPVQPGVGLSTPYRKADVPSSPATRQPFSVDPDAVDRSLSAHVGLQNEIAAFAQARRCTILSPGVLDPKFDVAWIDLQGYVSVVEVKSLTEANEEQQLRLGLGQILRYQHLLASGGREIQAILYVERKPADDAWQGLCSAHGVRLLWPEALSTLSLPTRDG